MTPQKRLDYLLEVVLVPSNRGRLKHSWVAEHISLAAADAVFAAIDSQSKPTALRFAAGDGIDTAAALWKQQAEAVAAGNPLLAPHLAELRDFELVWRPRWQVEGYQAEPTLASITAEIEAAALEAARAARAEQFRIVREQWLSAYGVALRWLNAAESGTADAPTFADLLEQLEAR